MRSAPYKELVETPHAQYLARAPFWRLAWMSYRGGGEYSAPPNLFSHRLENVEDHRRRLSRAYYLNYCRPVVDTYAAYLFRTPPAILPEDPIRRLAENADGRGGDLPSFIRKVFLLGAVYGHAVIGVDRPRSDEKPETRADELRLGITDYLHAVRPSDFLNWEADARGDLAWCLVRHRTRTATPESPNQPPRETYRLWEPEHWTDITPSGERTAEGAHPYGRVPFTSYRFRETDDPVIGESLIASIVFINREIFNLCSMLSEILYRQTFSQLVAEGSGPEYGEGGDISRLGTSSIFLYPEGRKAPSFISPDAAQTRLLMDQIDHLVDEIYRTANLARGEAREAKGGFAKSGISRAFDFLDTNQSLGEAAGSLAAAFARAIRIAAPEWNGRVKFPSDFGVTDRSDESGELPN